MKKPIARESRIAEIKSLKLILEKVLSATEHKTTTNSLRLNAYSNFLNYLLENEDSLKESEIQQPSFTHIDSERTLH